MKTLRDTMMFAAIVLAFYGCGRPPLGGIEKYNEEDYRLTLKLDHQSSPLTIGSPEGLFWYETYEGMQWVRGLPKTEFISTDHFSAQWESGDRQINFEVSGQEGRYRYEFSSAPNNDILAWGFSVHASGDEFFTGLFERTVDGNQKESWKAGIETAMDLRGEVVEMIIKPTLSLYTPFYISSANYGLFVDGTWPGVYDFCSSDSSRVKISFEGPGLSGIIYTAASPAGLVQAHALHTGPTIIPPQWAFSPWRWRDNHVNLDKYFDGSPVSSPFNSQVVEDILMMEALDIPCGVYWVDRPWAIGEHGYADFTWDTLRFPNPQKMIGWLHQRDIRFLLWIAPWVTGEMRSTAYSEGYALPMKYAPWGVDSTNAALLDFTNPQARSWWQENGIEKMLNQGVDGFKLDRSEELVPETREIKVADGRTARELRNDYPVEYVQAVHESCVKIKGNDFMLIPRAGYTGSARYAGFWGGDIGSPPEGLRAAIIAQQRAAIIGFPLWGSDIGGYWQGDLDREVCARWLAFGCFNPIMEFGPTEDRAPWSMDSEPHFDTTLIAIWRLYAKLHEKLATYSYEQAVHAHNTGMPVVRPLFLSFPEQKQAWIDWQTFMYGPDILVSAIWQKGIQEHSCYLPGGHSWVDAWDTKKIYKGGQWIKVSTPMHRIPIFIRQGSNLQLGDLNRLYEESLVLASGVPDMQQLEKEAFDQ